ncbi:uncharacterized protein SCHCODRAFT_02360194 [Schizophyllum commune H4-8]|uniref:uncharacterized protein n=1 Tax=Schizophyllum commune (strain H4-8 / FGSC 9210) TaxID=578458 RepID=UPI00215F6030|nr:uncharacterized protein SCHCODRAFT_02360194 [Schizophyllum commune H4-8]KAI5889130.1 hypothetical protein SCHCODRAFT_02360194 [Schizophyllum commune H4-8]
MTVDGRRSAPSKPPPLLGTQSPRSCGQFSQLRRARTHLPHLGGHLLCPQCPAELRRRTRSVCTTVEERRRMAALTTPRSALNGERAGLTRHPKALLRITIAKAALALRLLVHLVHEHCARDLISAIIIGYPRYSSMKWLWVLKPLDQAARQGRANTAVRQGRARSGHDTPQ